MAAHRAHAALRDRATPSVGVPPRWSCFPARAVRDRLVEVPAEKPAGPHGLAPDVEIVGEAPKVFRMAIVCQVAAVGWFGPVDKQSAETLAQLMRQVVMRAPTERFSVVHVVNSRVGVPDAETREVLAEISRYSTVHVACALVILAGAGFWASAVRSVMTSLRVMTQGTFDLRAHASIAETVAWLPAEHLKRTGVTITPLQLEHLLSTAQGWTAD